MKQHRNETICHTHLIRDRGWSDRLIALFLPEPTLVTNSWYKCAAPMKLYLVNNSVEASSEFQIEHAKIMNRQPET